MTTRSRARMLGLAAVVALVATACLTVNDRTDGTPTKATLAHTVAGDGISNITNVTTTGRKRAIATFAGAKDIFAIDHGVVLSTGRADDINATDRSRTRSTDNHTPGDPDLAARLTNIGNEPFTGGTYDAAALEFDFVPNGDRVTLDYVVASEDDSRGRVLSFDPDVVLVNGRDCVPFYGYYLSPADEGDAIDNRAEPARRATAMDWVGDIRSCNAPVNEGQVNHIKFLVGDHLDPTLDTNLLLPVDGLRVFSYPDWRVTVDPIGHLDPVTKQATVTGTVRDCNREFFVYTDPGVEVAQSQAYGEGTFEDGIRCTPGQIIPWSATTRAPYDPPYLTAGPAVVKVRDVAYELDGTEAGPGDRHIDDVTLIEDPPG